MNEKMAAPLHVVMLPWLAFGHMIPFRHLSIALAKSGVHVTYVSTPKNIQRLPQIPQTLRNLLEYEEIPMPRVEELPEEAEATVDLAFDQVQYLKLAYDLLEEPFSRIIANHSPDWIIIDFASYWVVNIAKIHGASLMFFSVFPAAALSFAGPKENIIVWGGEKSVGMRDPQSLTVKPSWVPFESSVALREFEAAAFHAGVHERGAPGMTDAERMAKVLEGCHAVAFRSCNELEGEYIDLFKSFFKKHVIPTGLLPPPKQLPNEAQDQTLDYPWSEAFKWLDERSSKSVVFVGFGSEVKLTKQQVHEIAYGLELSRLPFLWALRKPSWVDHEEHALPQGFRDRAFEVVGRVCFGWAPQQRILAHPSIGGCLVQCGWSSVVESLQHGHRLVALPFMFEQGLNARMLVDKELAVEVERREEDGSFSREDVARALRRAMGFEEEGEEESWAPDKSVVDVFGDVKLHQEFYIGGLVEYMRDATT